MCVRDRHDTGNMFPVRWSQCSRTVALYLWLNTLGFCCDRICLQYCGCTFVCTALVQGGQAVSLQSTSCWTWLRMKVWWTFTIASESWDHNGSTWSRQRLVCLNETISIHCFKRLSSKHILREEAGEDVSLTLENPPPAPRATINIQRRASEMRKLWSPLTKPTGKHGTTMLNERVKRDLKKIVENYIRPQCKERK